MNRPQWLFRTTAPDRPHGRAGFFDRKTPVNNAAITLINEPFGTPRICRACCCSHVLQVGDLRQLHAAFSTPKRDGLRLDRHLDCGREKENAQEPKFPRVLKMVGEEGLEPSKPYGG